MNYQELLLNKIDARKAKIAVIGLGYVGLPLAVAFARAGFSTIGIDTDAEKASAIAAAESYIVDVPTAELASVVEAGQLAATTRFEALEACDAVCICVPTPLSKTSDPDLSYVIGTVAAALYRRIVEQVVPVSSTAAAEMVKLLENTFRAVNIALVNEFLVMCDKLGLDAWEIIEAAATRPGAIIRSPHSRQTPFGDGCGVGAGFPS